MDEQRQFFKRDVQLVADAAMGARKATDNLRLMANSVSDARTLSIAITHLETAELYLKDLVGKTPEAQ